MNRFGDAIDCRGGRLGRRRRTHSEHLPLFLPASRRTFVQSVLIVPTRTMDLAHSIRQPATLTLAAVRRGWILEYRAKGERRFPAKNDAKKEAEQTGRFATGQLAPAERMTGRTRLESRHPQSLRFAVDGGAAPARADAAGRLRHAGGRSRTLALRAGFRRGEGRRAARRACKACCRVRRRNRLARRHRRRAGGFGIYT